MQLIAPPFPNHAAFFCRFMTETGGYLDEDQRHLHEIDFRDEQEVGGYAQCPFKDSRHGYLMNRSALKQIGSNWSEVVNGVAYYSSLFRTAKSDPSNLNRAWRISLASMFAPLYLLYRRDRPYKSGELPAAVAGAFKILLDVSTTIDLMVMSDRWSSTNGHHQASAKDLRDFAEDTLILLNGRYVCAGPDSLISEVNHFLFCTESEAAEHAGGFAKFFPDSFEFLEFNYVMSVQYIIGVIYQLLTMILMECGFAGIESKTVYSTVALEEESYPSAYERRRRIAFSYFSQADAQPHILRNLLSLCSNSTNWLISTKLIDTDDFVNCTIEVIEWLGREDPSPEAIAQAHQRVRQVTMQAIRLCQQRVGSLVVSTDFFPTLPLEYLSEQMPHTLLDVQLKAATNGPNS